MRSARVASHPGGTPLAPSRPVETAAPQPRAWSELFFRVATSLIFVVAGLGHVVRPNAMIARMLEAPLGERLAALLPVQPLMLLSGVLLIVAGAALAAGYRTRLAAAMLIAILVPITMTAHFGHGDDPGALLKNVALLGSLVHFAVGGSRARAVDRCATSGE